MKRRGKDSCSAAPRLVAVVCCCCSFYLALVELGWETRQKGVSQLLCSIRRLLRIIRESAPKLARKGRQFLLLKTDFTQEAIFPRQVIAVIMNVSVSILDSQRSQLIEADLFELVYFNVSVLGRTSAQGLGGQRLGMCFSLQL